MKGELIPPSPALPIAEQDSLQHTEYASHLLMRLKRLPDGWAVALRGPWGRGKTDVLGRVERQIAIKETPTGFASTISVSPWRHPQPDLLTPLVLSLLTRIPPSRVGGEKLKRAAKSVLAAGLAFGVKATARVVPLGGFLDDAIEPFTKLVENLLSDSPDDPTLRDDPDPISRMADRFRELVDAYLTQLPTPLKGGRLLICVDDLDRCLPDKQVAFLEAIHFLKAAEARVIFLVAIDPTLLRQAIQSHYGTDCFDSDAYLEKLFDFSQDLPDLQTGGVRSLLKAHLGRQNHGDPEGLSIIERLGRSHFSGMSKFIEQFEHGCRSPSLSNPRIIERACRRLELLCIAGTTGGPMDLEDAAKMRGFVIWLAASQRWPESRPLLSRRLREITESSPDTNLGAIEHAPFPQEIADALKAHPRLAGTLNDLHYCFQLGRISRFHGWHRMALHFGEFDAYFRSVGL